MPLSEDETALGTRGINEKHEIRTRDFIHNLKFFHIFPQLPEVHCAD